MAWNSKSDDRYDRVIVPWPPSVDMILSTHVMGKRCMDFSEITHHLKICTWNLRIDWIIFLYFTGFFLFLDLNRNFYFCIWSKWVNVWIFHLLLSLIYWAPQGVLVPKEQFWFSFSFCWLLKVFIQFTPNVIWTVWYVFSPHSLNSILLEIFLFFYFFCVRILILLLFWFPLIHLSQEYQK